MFRGRSSHKIDPKGRIIIPARFRDVLADRKSGGVMIAMLDGCLVAYPYDEWGKLEQRILDKAERSVTMRRFRRIFIGGAYDCSCDKQDRILVPSSLRTYAGLKKEIVLVGVLEHFEIWSKDNWTKEFLQMEEDLQQEEVRNEIAGLGL
jgi:MraZ protein